MAQKTKSVQQHVNEWLQWGYDTCIKYPIEIGTAAFALVITGYMSRGKAPTKPSDPTESSKPKTTNDNDGQDKAKKQDAVKKLEDLLRKPKDPKSGSDDGGDGHSPRVHFSQEPSVDHPFPMPSKDGALSAASGDDTTAQAAVVPVATIDLGHNIVTITFDGETVTMILAGLQALLSDNSPLAPYLAQAGSVAQLTINNDGTTTSLPLDHDETALVEGDGNEEEEEEEEEHHDDSDGTAIPSAAAEDDDNVMDRQQSHLEGDDEGVPVQGSTTQHADE